VSSGVHVPDNVMLTGRRPVSFPFLSDQIRPSGPTFRYAFFQEG
jgi:hypothetical protein